MMYALSWFVWSVSWVLALWSYFSVFLLVLCKYLKFWSNWLVSYYGIRFDPKPVHLFKIFDLPSAVYLFNWMMLTIYLSNCFTTNRIKHWSSKHVHYGPPSRPTGRIQQFAYNINYKQGATKLLKLLDNYLLMVIFENGENYCIRFKISSNA